MHGLGEERSGYGVGQGGCSLGGQEDGADQPSIGLGITRCVAVSGITWHTEPNRPIPTAAGSAVVSDDELNSRKNAAAVAVSQANPARPVSMPRLIPAPRVASSPTSAEAAR